MAVLVQRLPEVADCALSWCSWLIPVLTPLYATTVVLPFASTIVGVLLYVTL